MGNMTKKLKATKLHQKMVFFYRRVIRGRSSPEFFTSIVFSSTITLHSQVKGYKMKSQMPSAF